MVSISTAGDNEKIKYEIINVKIKISNILLFSLKKILIDRKIFFLFK
jgi:hypothetical protein